MEPGTRILETDRLILRELTRADLDPLAALYRDPDIRRYFPEGTLTREETLEELDWIIDEYYAKHGFGLWATIHKETGAFIGRCGLIPWTLEGKTEVEVAYLLAKDYWGQGLGFEAARAILDHAFGPLGLARIICMAFPENTASRRIAEKLGMSLEFEGVMDGEAIVIYAIQRG